MFLGITESPNFMTGILPLWFENVLFFYSRNRFGNAMVGDKIRKTFEGSQIVGYARGTDR